MRDYEKDFWNKLKKMPIYESGNYSFDKLSYVKNREKVIVTCKKHGDFTIRACNILMGVLCKKCQYENHGNMISLSYDQIIDRFKSKHGNKYIYPDFIKNTSIKIPIICKEHGVFYQNAELHFRSGCQKCSYKIPKHNKLSVSIFEERSTILHKGLYTYNQDYVKAREKVIITCKLHGDFYQTASDHLKGKGCKKCGFLFSNYSKTQWIERNKTGQASFYVLKCTGNGEEFLKIGITQRTVKSRYSKNSIPYKIEIIYLETSSYLDKIWDKEKNFIKDNIKYRYYPLLKFRGMTETFLIELADSAIGDSWGSAKM